MAKRRGLGKAESVFRLSVRQVGVGWRPAQGVTVVEPFDEVAIAATG